MYANRPGDATPGFSSLDLVDLGNGRVMVTWEDIKRGTPEGIAITQVHGKIYELDGSQVGPQLDLTPSERIERHAGATFETLSNGNVVMMTQRYVYDLTPDANGQFQDKSRFEFTVFNNDGLETTIDIESSSSLVGEPGRFNVNGVEAIKGGGFYAYVEWVLHRSVGFSDAPDPKLLIQQYDAAGNKTGKVIEIKHSTVEGTGDVTALANGGVVVTISQPVSRPGNYTASYNDRSVSVYIFDAAGNQVGTNFLASQRGEGMQMETTTLALDDGRFVVIWDDTVFTRFTRETAVRAQIFNPDGSRAGGEQILVSDDMRPNDELEVFSWRSADVTPDGDILLTWEELGTGHLFWSKSFDIANTLRESNLDDELWLTFGNDRANAGIGDDTIRGNKGDDTILGNKGEDILIGGVGNDRLIAGQGNDTLNGGAGNDILFGGADRDTFLFNTTPSAATNIDTISGYSADQDKISLDNVVFTGLGLATGQITGGMFNTGIRATQKDDRIIYNESTGALIYDADGVRGVPGVQFAVVSGAPSLSALDFFVI